MKDMWREGRGWTPALEKKYNAIQEEVYSIRQEAEDSLVRLGSGSVPWSLRLKKAGDTVKYWILALNQVQRRKVCAKTLYCLATSLSISAIGMGIDGIESRLHEA